MDDLEAFLEEEGIPVEELTESEKIIKEKLEIEEEDEELIEDEAHGEELVLELELVQPDRIETGILYTIGLVASGYAALIDAGYDAELLEATVLDDDHQPFGSFDVLTSWAEEYNEGITTARKYGNKPWTASKSE